MAMTMNGEVQLAASREAVWAKLNDPEVLKACIPGCEELEKTEDNGFRATAKMKVGPVSARFKGKVTLSDLDPPNGYRISGEGEGGVAGFAKGGATVALSEKDGGTLLSYNVEAQIGGKLAQLGQRLINGAAKNSSPILARLYKADSGLKPRPNSPVKSIRPCPRRGAPEVAHCR
jgi:carbon monoxide dehydrogenase subunit G